jgi:hypothetical protein
MFFDVIQKKYIHHLLVVGYAGGNTQEQCFYKVVGSNLEKGDIWISKSIESAAFDLFFTNGIISQTDTVMSESDLEIQHMLNRELDNYVTYDSETDFYFLKDNLSAIEYKKFQMTNKFPLKIIRFLANVYWPFSTIWK